MSIQKARSLRSGMTDAEKLLWQHLRNRQLQGCKFRRQHPVGPYIVDFICLDKMLVIELDGGQHAMTIDYDKKRTRYLEANGYTVMRFWNNEILQHQDSVLTLVLNEITSTSPSPQPSPQGRGSAGHH